MLCEYWIGFYVPVLHVYISSFVYADLYKAVHISCILWYAFIKVVDFCPRHLFIFIWGFDACMLPVKPMAANFHICKTREL